jgi:hypothetical protein
MIRLIDYFAEQFFGGPLTKEEESVLRRDSDKID